MVNDAGLRSVVFGIYLSLALTMEHIMFAERELYPFHPRLELLLRYSPFATSDSQMLRNNKKYSQNNLTHTVFRSQGYFALKVVLSVYRPISEYAQTRSLAMCFSISP